MLDNAFMTIENKVDLLDNDVDEVLQDRIYLMPALAQAACLCWHLGSDWMESAQALIPLSGGDFNVLHRVERLSWIMRMNTAPYDTMVLIPHMLVAFNRSYYEEDPAAQLTVALPESVNEALSLYLPAPSDYVLYAAAMSMLLPECMEHNTVPFQYAYTKLNRFLVTEGYTLPEVNSVLTNVLSFLEEVCGVLHREKRYFNTVLALILSEVGSTLAAMEENPCGVEFSPDDLDDLLDDDNDEGIYEDEIDPWDICDLNVTELPEFPTRIGGTDLTEDELSALLDELDENTLEALPLIAVN